MSEILACAQASWSCAAAVGVMAVGVTVIAVVFMVALVRW